MTVRVRLFAALRDLAGAPEVRSDGTTVGEVLDELATRFGEEFTRIAAAGSVVVDGERADADRSVVGASEIAVLPPFSGG